MKNFRIIADGSADLSDEIIAQRDIAIVPFYVMLGAGEYLRQGEELTDAAFYDWMVKNPTQFPKSSAPAAQDFFELFVQAAAEGEKVLCLCITSKFSTSYQSAVIAREMTLEEYPEAQIAVIDTTVNTVTQGLMVLEACDLRDAGTDFDEATRIIESLKATGRIFFTVGGIEYLQIGGRIGKLAGKVTQALNIKPLIRLEEGEIHAAGIARGRKKSLEKVLDIAKAHISECFASQSDLSITVGYGYDLDEARGFCDNVRAMLRSLGMDIDVSIRRIGSVIGVHTGPHPLGIGLCRRSESM